MIDYLRFYIPVKNFSLIWRCHHYWWKAVKFRPMLHSGPNWTFSSCHTCCDMGPRFFRSHLKDCPIQPPFMTHKGMWSIYSNSDPHFSTFSRLVRHTRGCGVSMLIRIILNNEVSIVRLNILTSIECFWHFSVNHYTLACYTVYYNHLSLEWQALKSLKVSGMYTNTCIEYIS
jgi:hypothetical protein